MILKPFQMKKRATRQQQVLPKALREQVWLTMFGQTFSNTCYITWRSNKITPFDSHIGHEIPESKRGTNSLDNLFPICSRCNLSVNNRYTIEKWMIDFVKIDIYVYTHIQLFTRTTKNKKQEKLNGLL